MQSTRQAILDYLRMHREASVRDLSQELSLTTTGIRQHLAVLEEAGLVSFREVKGRVGRPALIYSLTEAAEALYPKAYDRLLIAMLQSAREVCEGDLQGRLVAAVGSRLAASFPDASDGTLATRATTAAEYLRAEGNIVEVEVIERSPGVVRIVQRTCPYQGASAVAPSVCAIDTERLSRATGCEVELTESRPSGDEHCVFELTLAAAN